MDERRLRALAKRGDRQAIAELQVRADRQGAKAQTIVRERGRYVVDARGRARDKDAWFQVYLDGKPHRARVNFKAPGSKAHYNCYVEAEQGQHIELHAQGCWSDATIYKVRT